MTAEDLAARVAAIAEACANAPCLKCDGTGHRPEYAHVDGGMCWACNGHGRRFIPDGT
jgi:hypothetical protein